MSFGGSKTSYSTKLNKVPKPFEEQPLEQNEMNLEQDGVQYKVVFEEPKLYEVNVSQYTFPC